MSIPFAFREVIATTPQPMLVSGELSGGLVAPVYRLATELLAEVFVMNSRPEQTDFEEETDTRQLIAAIQSGPYHVFPRLISRVSSRFRDVALGTSKLWSIIVITAQSDSHRIQAYLQRSGDAPLDVFIALEGSWTESPTLLANVRRNIDLLALHSGRWRRLLVRCLREDMHLLSAFAPISSLCRTSAPNLIHLSLDVDWVDYAPVDITADPAIFTSGTPSLTCLRLRGMAPQAFRPPLSTVTALDLAPYRGLTFTDDMFRALLGECKSLVDLAIWAEGQFVNLPFSPQQAKHKLPHLESLVISSSTGAGFSKILNMVDAPRLRVLELHGLLEGDLDTLWSHGRGLSIHFPQVEVFVASEWIPSDEIYDHLFEIFPSVAMFRCPHATFETSRLEKYLTGRTRRENGDHCWTGLRYLTLGFDDREEISSLLEALHTRKLLGYPLTEVGFAAEVGVSLDIFVAEEDLERIDGLGVRIYREEEKRWPSSVKELKMWE
ncbi:hypothetical protein CC1G_03213 [Coprinopsis cinerea okayama7|uniref:F-box domain-containing protein n=1 Tax=Coprinopsis cinerea (strain Okayama-7 / 130 / ATCC MYA-4618 / FGSC 9003) TaxID=240176 RepID=A8N770_COPC7|nr:hypothetical protein CC1G_03213 [Coprinopsis cinerea okayama7\|eukprot:XP_001830676.2 hypothetical protein CC1G_03213 [Coprinopsis cinerea okayama7\